MNQEKIMLILDSFRDAAHEMLRNSMYVLSELGNVNMPDELRARTRDVFTELVGTKHDVINEIETILEKLDDGGNDMIAPRLELVRRWCLEDMTKVHELVTELSSEGERDGSGRLAYMLVAESATNILLPLGKATRAMKDLGMVPCSGSE